ncbi:MAG: peptidyl-prolyl cis-trans isomerase [Oscillospiraceae bacterium]|jgi:hypothetical protein|nr:peptidyl-prolyl cis-trans isomerase [Oscillospiraceae bacterium]
MSGMFDKKTKKAQKKQAITKKQEKAKKKSKIITVSVIVIFAIFLSTALIINSNLIRRTVPVLTIDGISFNTTEFEYFFNVQYQLYIEQLNQSGMEGMGPTRDRPLRDQIAWTNPETEKEETWADVLYEMTIERLAFLVAFYNDATRYGFKLNEDHLDAIEFEVEMIILQAGFNGMSADSLLQHMYGPSMNIKTFRNVLTFTAAAEFFSEYTRESFNFSDAELNEYYNEHADEFDVHEYRIMLIYADMPDRMDFIDDEEGFEEATEKAIEEAYELALSIANDINTEEEFIAAALNYNEDQYSEPDSTLQRQQARNIGLEVDIAIWFNDPARAYGDVTAIPAGNLNSVVFYISRNDNNYHTLSMNQLLILREKINPADFEDGEEDPEYIEALAEAEKEALERAEEVYQKFIDAGGTKEALLDLIEEYSDENTPEGFYDNITLFSYRGFDFTGMRVSEELETWLFDDSRQVGDVELIKTADHGYHLTMFAGEGDIFAHLIARDRLRTEAHNDWVENLPKGEPTKHFMFILVHM